ncbi:5'-methylthioadenosine/S-adenosylhomocysteine nucleosidase [Dysgonomonas sp. 520]|uniref:5'-methylthioadenosine/S-adenosylhomocysteine nucleosidase family protein n=1 Tax=Dysgonomonas sp. 520 TaxID=2302931 RepID=UPI0013D5240B|nr:5'-methylthioadenosine/S-adenosylhomocysteine nucleosidase [Dysgonomonas sp. 520]NDW08827.1 nucleosidase [Dysgonomonas sp. 520]
MFKKLLKENPVFVFALESEASDKFSDVNPLFIGVGKVNAAYHLTRKIKENKPSIIVNLGSAGSNHFDRGSVVCCTKFVQRDMDATMIGAKMYETPFSGVGPVLEYGLKVDGLDEGICGTGDSFEVNHNTMVYNVIDMEAYPLAYIAQQEQIPFLCLKYISDGADDSAAEDWETTVKHAAEALRKTLDNF